MLVTVNEAIFRFLACKVRRAELTKWTIVVTSDQLKSRTFINQQQITTRLHQTRCALTAPRYSLNIADLLAGNVATCSRAFAPRKQSQMHQKLEATSRLITMTSWRLLTTFSTPSITATRLTTRQQTTTRNFTPISSQRKRCITPLASGPSSSAR